MGTRKAKKGAVTGAVVLVLALLGVAVVAALGSGGSSADGAEPSASTATATATQANYDPDPDPDDCEAVSDSLALARVAKETTDITRLDNMYDECMEAEEPAEEFDGAETALAAATASTEAAAASTVPASTQPATCETWSVSVVASPNTRWMQPNEGDITALMGGQENLELDRDETLQMLHDHPDRLAKFAWIYHEALGEPAELTDWKSLVNGDCLNVKGYGLYAKVEAFIQGNKWVWRPVCDVDHDGTGISPEGNLIRREGLGNVASYGCWVFYKVADPTQDPQVQEPVDPDKPLGSVSALCLNPNIPGDRPDIPVGEVENPEPKPPTDTPDEPDEPESPPDEEEPPPAGKDHRQSPVSSDRNDPVEVDRPHVTAPAEVIRPTPAPGVTTTTQAPPPPTIADPPEVQNPEPAATTTEPTPYTPEDPIDECGDADGDGIPDCG